MSNPLVYAARHVVMAHLPDWMETPDVKDAWDTGVREALTGDEDRVATRRVPRTTITYAVTTHNSIETARLRARVRAGLKSGRWAVPWLGRGAGLAWPADPGDTVVHLERADHLVEANSYLLILSPYTPDFDSWDLAVVDAVSGPDLELCAPLAHSYPEGTRAWPLLIGRPELDSLDMLNLGRARARLVTTFDGRDVLPSAYDDFGDYEAGADVDGSDGGAGWDGAWAVTSS